MNRRTFLQGAALLGSALGIRLPKPPKLDAFLSRRLAWLESHPQEPYIAQPGDSMYIGGGEAGSVPVRCPRPSPAIEWTDDNSKTWHTCELQPRA